MGQSNIPAASCSIDQLDWLGPSVLHAFDELMSNLRTIAYKKGLPLRWCMCRLF